MRRRVLGSQMATASRPPSKEPLCRCILPEHTGLALLEACIFPATECWIPKF